MNTHPTSSSIRPMMENLEQRSYLSGSVNLVVSFYGLGGAGGFGNDWMDKITAQAGSDTHSKVLKFDENQGAAAVKATLRAIDTNHNHRIDKSELNKLNLRVIGYSLGGIQAANFAQDLLKSTARVDGYKIAYSVPIRDLVTLDPVQSIIKPTDGVPGNVKRFGNYYQQKGGSTTVGVYTQTFDIKVTSITVDDPSNITGGPLTSSARTSRQIRIDKGAYADTTMSHEVYSGVNGKIDGKKVNHGTVPFYAYDWALSDLDS